SNQEDTYEIEMKYLEILRELRGRQIKMIVMVSDYVTQAAARPYAFATWVPDAMLIRSVSAPVRSPLDVVADDGQPLIPEDAKMRVRNRMGLPDPNMPRPSPPPSQAPQPPPGAQSDVKTFEPK